jgi:hypothetical protein
MRKISSCPYKYGKACGSSSSWRVHYWIVNRWACGSSSQRRPLGALLPEKEPSPRADRTPDSGYVPRGPHHSRKRLFPKTKKKKNPNQWAHCPGTATSADWPPAPPPATSTTTLPGEGDPAAVDLAAPLLSNTTIRPPPPHNTTKKRGRETQREGDIEREWSGQGRSRRGKSRRGGALRSAAVRAQAPPPVTDQRAAAAWRGREAPGRGDKAVLVGWGYETGSAATPRDEVRNEWRGEVEGGLAVPDGDQSSVYYL